MSNIFTKERPNEINPNSEYNKNKIMSAEIKDIINKIFKKEEISSNDKENINKLILLKKSRRQLLKEINNYCLNNINASLLNEISYENISNLLKEALKVLQIEKDYESVKLILNFATSFYQIYGEKEKKKLFIQNNLINQKVFSNYDFWKELIKYDIVEEMYNQKSFNLFSEKNEDEEKNKERIKDIVVSKINIFLNYMIDLQCKFSFMKQIIQEFKDYYELNEDNVSKFITKINEYNKTNDTEKEIKENDIIDDDNLNNLNINEINDKLNTEEEKKSNSTEENSQK
jgi:hypothetical protein